MNDASIAVVFSADTGQYVANIEGMDAATAKSAQAVAQAKNIIKSSLEEQAQAAVKAGASANQLASIQQRAAARMASVTGENANKIINSLNRISDKNKAVAAEMANLKVPEAEERSDVTNRMRSATLLRGGGLRGAENFAAQFEIFNKIATVAFPVLGLATLTEEAFKLGKALYDAFDLGGARARQTASEVQSVDNELRNSSTSLDVQIDRLQQEQAKLEKKPFNGIKLALDEASEASEKLQKELEGVFAAELKVISGMSASLPQRLLSGGSDTHQEQVMLQEHNKWQQQQPDIQGQLNESSSYGSALQARLAELRQRQADNAAAMAAGEGGVSLTLYSEEIKAVQTLIGWQRQEHASIQKTIELQKQQGDTQAARDKHGADEINKSNTANANKAAEAQLKAMEAHVNEWKLLASVSAKALYDFWDAQRNAFAKGSTEYNAIVAKQATLAEEGARRVHEAIEKYKESQKKEVGNPFALDRDVNVMGNSPETYRALQDAQGKSRLSSDEVTASVARTRVQIDLANGSISKFAATQQLASIDAQLHASRIADLNRQIEDLKKSSGSYNGLTDTFASDKEQKEYVGLQAQITKESGQAAVDQMQTSAQLAGETWSGALKNANQLWLQDSRNTADQVSSLFKQAVDGINDELSDLMTGKKTNWSSMFSGLAKSLASDGLRQGEAGLANLFKPSSSSSSSSSTGILGGIGGFFSHLFGGNRAIGGDVSVGQIYRINEQGQELFAPSTNGKMVPAKSWGNGGGASAFYNINVQKGVTPEEFHMGVRSALSEYHAKVMPAGARQAVADGNSRRPRGA